MNLRFPIRRCGFHREVCVSLRDGRLQAHCSCVAGQAGVPCSHVMELLRVAADPGAHASFLATCADRSLAGPLSQLRSILPDELTDDDPVSAAFNGRALQKLVTEGLMIGPTTSQLLRARGIAEPPAARLSS
ncbi:MAG TPA: hypothetical protein VM074_02750 [Solimonas sp.]|nr:hypothetical protein [Solimonas sp.]